MSKLLIKFDCSEEDRLILEDNTHLGANWFNNRDDNSQYLYLKYLKSFLKNDDSFDCSLKAIFQVTLFNSFFKKDYNNEEIH